MDQTLNECSKFLTNVKNDIIMLETMLGYDTSYTKIFWSKKIKTIEEMEQKIDDLYDAGEEREATKNKIMMNIAFQYLLEDILLAKKELEETLFNNKEEE